MKNNNKNKIKITSKDKIDILEIRKKIRKSPVPKINKLSPPSKTKSNANSNNVKEKKYLMNFISEFINCFKK